MPAPVILITGATRGIGFAAARQLATRGARGIIASRDLQRAEKAARQTRVPPRSYGSRSTLRIHCAELL